MDDCNHPPVQLTTSIGFVSLNLKMTKLNKSNFFFKKWNVVFPVQVEFSYFFVHFRLKIFLIIKNRFMAFHTLILRFILKIKSFQKFLPRYSYKKIFL